MRIYILNFHFYILCPQSALCHFRARSSLDTNKASSLPKEWKHAKDASWRDADQLVI